MTAEFDDEVTIRRSPSDLRTSSPEGVDWAASTTMGRRRDNQDAWGERDGAIFVVADGVGGTAGGKVASSAAVTAFLQLPGVTDWADALERINETVVLSCRTLDLPDAATTLVACKVDGDHAEVVHVGDSRAYLLHPNQPLIQLTVDHSVGERRLAAGRAEDDADDGLGKPSALLGFLGVDQHNVEVSVHRFLFSPGDRILLCSDGIHDQLTPHEMQRLLAAETVAEAAAMLTRAADEAGGRDNATAIVIEQP